MRTLDGHADQVMSVAFSPDSRWLASGSFDHYIWQFTDYKTLRRSVVITFENMPAKTEESKAMSRDLKKRSFRFVGPTICYAYMQATGMVNDHLTNCFRAPRE